MSPPDEPLDGSTWRLCWVIVLGAFASGLDASIVNVGLDSISHALRAPLSLTQWVASGYLLALAVSLPAVGWAARRLGSRRLWLLSLAAFTLASIACAAAPTVQLLLLARVVQGLAGGVLIPTGQTILGQAVGPARLGRVMGTLGVAVSAAPVLGSLCGGVLLHSAPWPWLFLINVPIGAAGLMLGHRLIPHHKTSEAPRPHLTGLALIVIGLPGLVYAATRWGSAGHLTADIDVSACVAVVALVAFTITSLRSDRPLLALRLHHVPAFRAGALTAFCSGVLLFGSGVLFALYFQLRQGQSPLGAGISLAGLAGASAVSAPLTGRWIDRRGPGRAGLTGGLLATITSGAMMALAPMLNPWTIQPLLIAFGVAVNLVAMPAGVAAYRAVTTAALPDAITQINILQRVGGSLGGAVCAVLIARDHPDIAFRQAVLPLVAAALGCTVGAWLIHRNTVPRQGIPAIGDRPNATGDRSAPPAPRR